MKKIILIFIILILGDIAVSGLRKNRQPGQEAGQLTPLVSLSKEEVLRFSVIGDPESDLENLEKGLKRAKEKGSEFVILVGDLTKTGELRQLEAIKEILDDSGIKYYLVPGNHDLYSSKKLTKEPKKYFISVFGRPYCQVPINKGEKKISLILIDNSDENLGIEKEQMDFIKQNLAPGSADLKLAFLHLPVYHPTSNYLMGYRNKIVSKQKEELLKIFKEASVDVVFAGHLHNTSSHEKNGIKMFIAGSVNSSRNWQTPRYLEVKVYEDKSLIVSEVEL